VHLTDYLGTLLFYKIKLSRQLP